MTCPRVSGGAVVRVGVVLVARADPHSKDDAGTSIIPWKLSIFTTLFRILREVPFGVDEAAPPRPAAAPPPPRPPAYRRPRRRRPGRARRRGRGSGQRRRRRWWSRLLLNLSV